MSKPKTMDILADRMFDDIDQLADIPVTQREQILRYRAIFSLKLETPHITNENVAKMLKEQFGITSIGQAYRDISATERMLGNVRSSEKQWIRYLVVETLKEAIKLAKEKGEIKEMVAASDKLGKYARLDQEDQDPMPYEDIVPLPIEYVNDPELLGRPAPKEGIKAYVERIKRKYIEDEAVNIEHEEVKRES